MGYRTTRATIQSIQIIEWSIGINNIMYWAFVPVVVWLLCIFLCCALTTAIVGDDL